MKIILKKLTLSLIILTTSQYTLSSSTAAFAPVSFNGNDSTCPIGYSIHFKEGAPTPSCILTANYPTLLSQMQAEYNSLTQQVSANYQKLVTAANYCSGISSNSCKALKGFISNNTSAYKADPNSSALENAIAQYVATVTRYTALNGYLYGAYSEALVLNSQDVNAYYSLINPIN